MPRNGGRVGPTAKPFGTDSGGLWTLAEHYQQVRSGNWTIIKATGGTTVTANGYVTHTFTSSGTLTVAENITNADILVVAGGGGGGGGYQGGGGGAGGMISRPAMSLSPGNYTVTVGAGGRGASSGLPPAGGNNSSIGLLTAIGGGRGNGEMQAFGASGSEAATSGGSGGGTGHSTYGSALAGTQPSQSGDSGLFGYGTSGGTNWGGCCSNAGGGGASVAGTYAPSDNNAGSGGAGRQWFDSTGYAGGGAGANRGAGNRAAGGYGGGGAGGNNDSGTAGTANTGGGGGAGGSGSGVGVGAAGGSGIVIVRYPISSLWSPDSLASNLRIALPLNTALGTSDYSATIKGTGSNRVVTAANSAAISATQSKYYGSSLDNGTESQDRYLSIPNSSDLALGTSDFCIEGWFYFTANNIGYQSLAAHSGDSADQQNGWILITETTNQLYFYASDNGGWDVGIATSVVPATNTWHHIAVTRNNSVFRMFFNGVQVGTTTSAANITLPSSREFRLGSYRYIPGYPQSFNGFIQDFRMYIGAAKYTTNFAPPGPIYVGP
jgi:Concanavalin A-like lectin/glucanases superfamily